MVIFRSCADNLLGGIWAMSSPHPIFFPFFWGGRPPCPPGLRPCRRWKVFLHSSYSRRSEMLCVDRMTSQAISCIASTISTMCPNRLKYLTLLREIASFVCSSTEQQGSPESSRYCYWGVVKHLKQLKLKLILAYPGLTYRIRGLMECRNPW